MLVVKLLMRLDVQALHHAVSVCTGYAWGAPPEPDRRGPASRAAIYLS